MTSFSKNDLDSQLVLIEALESGDVPTILVRGKERPVNVANHKRKLRKQAINAHQQKLLAGLVTVAVDAGHLKAAGTVQQGRLVVYLDGLPVEEEI